MGGIGQAVGRVLAPFMVGPLRRLKPVPASVVAAAMIRAALDAPRGVTVLENEDILGLGSTRRWRDPDLPDGVIPLPPEPAGTSGR